jgi:hypothetical protein
MMEEVNRAIAVSVGLGDWRPEERREEKPRIRVSETTSSPVTVPESVPAAAAAVVDVPAVAGANETVTLGAVTPDVAPAQS